MLFKSQQDIATIDEISEAYVQYFFVNEDGERTGKWVGVVDGWSRDYNVLRDMLHWQLSEYEKISHNKVRSWKTVSGAIKFIKYKYKDQCNAKL